MTTSAIREKLYDFIRVADEKKVKAIYMMLEDDISETAEWWESNAFVNQLNKEYAAWQSDKEKGYSLSEIDDAIEKLKKKRQLK